MVSWLCGGRCYWREVTAVGGCVVCWGAGVRRRLVVVWVAVVVPAGAEVGSAVVVVVVVWWRGGVCAGLGGDPVVVLLR